MATNLAQDPRQPYRYTPLNHERTIRLLKVTNISSPNQQCWNYSLINTELDDAPPFETLSYVWGSNALDHALMLRDGSVLRITENLDCAMSDILPHCSTGFLWIDQVCIDQKNDTERGHQVKIMGDIYATGFQVLVWLGPTDLPPCTELDVIFSAADQVLQNSRPTEIILKHLQLLLLGDVALKNGELTMFRDDRLLALWQLYKYLGSPWFSRGWVFQEIVLSKQSKFVVGSSAVSLEGLYCICQAIQLVESAELLQVGLDEAILSAHFEMISIMRHTWLDWHRSDNRRFATSCGFVELLSTIIPKMMTTLSQDRVYAFLGLNRNPKIVIEPTYSCSGHEALVSTVKAVIEGTERLDIFAYLCRQGDGDAGLPFVRRSPTWVPEFPSPPHPSPLSRSLIDNQQSQKHVGRFESNILVAHGKPLDRILARVYPRLPPYMNGQVLDFSHYVTSAVCCWEKSTKQAPKPTPQSVFAALVAEGHCSDSMALPLLGDEELPSLLLSVERHYFNTLMVKAGANFEVIHTHWERLQEATSAMWNAAYKRFLFVTETGRLVLGSTLEPEDTICILHGCSYPVGLRPDGNGNWYVQESCVMEGAMDAWRSGMVDWRDDESTEFKLV